MEKKQDYIPFDQRTEWSDITPLVQDDGPDPVCPISYTPQFKETMNYFRAIVKKDEKSERALQLTKEVINLNAANYTAWYYRRLCLEELKGNLKEEVEYCNKIAEENQKNYQVWYHRQWCIEKTKDISQELDFTGEMLRHDNKNYHVWSYRQFIVETFKLWEEESKFILELLQLDIRNNSAWNERFFVVSKWKGWNQNTRKEEIDFAISMIKKAPNNQSPWLYLKGVVRGATMKDFGLKEIIEQLKEKFSICPHIYSFLIDILEEESTKEAIKLALEHCELLANKLDTIHSKYWNYRHQNLSKKL